MTRGYTEINVGEVVTADYMNDQWLRQGVLFFADEAARDAAVLAPEEGMHAYLADLDCMSFYDGAAWRQILGSVRKNSAGPVFHRRRLNLIEGTNITLTVSDDGADDEVDVVIASAVAPVDRAVISGWGESAKNLSASIVQLKRFAADGTSAAAAAIPHVPSRAGSIIGLSVAMAAARTAGTATFEVYLNGVGTGLVVTIDATHTQYNSAAQAAALDPFLAGDRIDVRMSGASFSPVTGNFCVADVTVQFD